MSRVGEPGPIIGISWASTRFRAYLIAANGQILDSHEEPSGVAGLPRGKMVETVAALQQRWPGARQIYVSGMIGSAMGWIDVGYADAPAGIADIARRAMRTTIGDVPVIIVPGVACRRAVDDAPDVMRGEELEIFGAVTDPDGLVMVPGLHTKTVAMRSGRITEFATSLSGEIFARLTQSGLLASIVDADGVPGVAFEAGVETARAGALGLGALLFGARARVVRGDLETADAASYIRGLLIGADLADAAALFGAPTDGQVTLVGDAAACALSASALALIGVSCRVVDAQKARVEGFRLLDGAVHG